MVTARQSPRTAMDPANKNKIAAGLMLAVVIALIVIQVVAVVPLWNSKGASGDLNIKVPGRYSVRASHLFTMVGEPAVEGSVTLTDSASGTPYSIDYYLYSNSLVWDTVTGGGSLWLPSGMYDVTITGTATVEIYLMGIFNTSPSDPEMGETYSFVITVIACCILLAISVQLWRKSPSSAPYGRMTVYQRPPLFPSDATDVDVLSMVNRYIANQESRGSYSYIFMTIANDLGVPEDSIGTLQRVLDRMVANGSLKRSEDLFFR